MNLLKLCQISVFLLAGIFKWFLYTENFLSVGMKLLLTWKALEEEVKIITNVLAVCKHIKLNHEYCLEVTTTAKPVPAAATQTWRSLVLSVVSDPLSCLFLVSALPLCHWQGVEKLVHYFSDKAWYSTISDSLYHLPHGHFCSCFVSSSLHGACQSLHEISGM